MKELLENIRKIVRQDQIFEHEPMASHVTFRSGGEADVLVTPEYEQLRPLMKCLYAQERIPVTVIGNGSNLLVGDRGIRGVVVEIGKPMQQILISGNIFFAQAGTMLSSLAAKALERGKTGLEFAAGIPGTVGGAMVMNAGAYGGEMKDVVTRVQVLTKEGDIIWLSKEDMQFAYRSSVIEKAQYIVLAVEIQLKDGDKEQIAATMKELREKRISKQPLEYASAGSTFKRPEGYFAGKLIQDAGLGGYSCGAACVSKKHCGFVINQGGASSGEILSVIRHVQQVVKEQFGVELETEVKMIGEF